MDKMLDNVKTLMFCDESKFYKANGDFDDAIYYFALSAEKKQIGSLNRDINEVIKKHNINSKVFHATSVFRKQRPRIGFMKDLTQIIIKYKLHCFCYKYSKPMLFETTKILKIFNNEILNFEKVEFQALFYFMISLNTYLRDEKPRLLSKEISMFFDRNVYGIREPEAFNFPSHQFVIKQMTFSEKSLVSLLLLPDFFGYIFRLSKQSKNKVQSGDKTLETSPVVVNSYQSLVNITNARLFHFLDFDEKKLIDSLINYT